MSWDIILFNSRQTIKSVEEIDENLLEPTDFCSVLESYFDNIDKDDNHRRIKGTDFEIEFFTDSEEVNNKILNLYGENGLFEIVILAQKNGWQIFDTGLEQMIELNNPKTNGYINFDKYLKQVLDSSNKNE